MLSGIRIAALMLLPIGAAIPLSAQGAGNPLTEASALTFQAPRYDLIKDVDYQPAFEEGMKQELAEVLAIANNPAPPTFDNTIVAMERTGRLLERVALTFGAVVGANTNPALDRVQAAEAPKRAAEQDAINLNPKLFARIKAVYDQRATLKLDPESLQLLNVTYQDFVHAGANLPEAGKSRLEQINKELAERTTSFRQKLVAATKAAMLVVDDKAQLDGLSDAQIANAGQAATDHNLRGKWVIPLQNTTQQPSLVDLTDRATRKKLFDDRWTATEKSDANDTRAVVLRIAKLRAEKAQLLGYPNYSAYVLYNQMTKTPDAVLKFLDQLVVPTAAKAAEEARLIQAAIDQDGPHFDLKPWDWQRYAAQVRKERYHLDDNEVRPYFELHTVLEQGVFYAATQLYGVTFKRRQDLPVWQPDMIAYEVIDHDGAPLGLVYFDFYRRDNKEGGAWTGTLVQESHLLGTRPVVYNVLNLTKPAPGQPALISFGDVITLFHEFGHALHGLFADSKYPSLSGTRVARDFVEFPSQFNEHWALYPAVLKHYAINHATGKVIPDALVERIKKAQIWGQGYQLGELLAASELDMKWHLLPASANVKDVDSFETLALQDTHTDFVNVPPRYRSSYFLHIWGSGYASGYYAYQWTVMLDDDAFAWFTAHGGLTRANGQRFRDLILSRGHTEDYGPMFRAFYGKDPDIGPMLEHRGLTLK
jgi:peptidyl-dipeptidase Dcp